jgi:polyisoprenoid-binding protein YceI
MRQLFFTFIALAFLAAAPAAARDKLVQQWVPAAASLDVDIAYPSGAHAAGTLQVQNFTPDFRFDPRDLDNSVMSFTAFIMPARLPGNRDIDEQTRAEAGATFISTRIREKGRNEFEALGMFSMNGRSTQILFPFTVTPGPGDETRLVFTARFNAPAGNLAPHFGIQSQVPLRMHVEATPVP